MELGARPDATTRDGDQVGPDGGAGGGLSRALPAALLVLCAAYLVLIVAQQGIYWDEYPQRLHGQAVLDWYLSGFSDTTVFEQGNLYLYGGLIEAAFEAVVRLVPVDPYLVRHALVACLALVTAAGVWRLGVVLGDRRVGVLALALLLLTPRFIGHGSFNSKDMPTAAFYVWTLVLFVRDVRRPIGSPLATVLPVGIVLGLLLGTRIGAAIVLPAVAAGYLQRWWTEGRKRSTMVFLSARFSIAFLVAWAVMLIGWPWALRRPLFNPVLALFASSRFPWGQDQLYQGRVVSSLELPTSYVPVWLLQTLPEVTLLGLVLAAIYAFRRILVHRRAVGPGMTMALVAGLFPLSYVVAANAALYDAVRHLLFLQPLLALAASWGLLCLVDATRLRSRWLSGLVAGGIVLGGATTAAEMAALAPYEYIYFNRVSGGIQAAEGKFELDYWGLSYREGVERLAESAPAGARLASCSHPGSVFHFARGHFDYVGGYVFELWGRPEYVLMTAPLDCEEALPPGPRQPIVSRRGVPLLHLIEVDEVAGPARPGGSGGGQ